jgi:hypothetical protein
MMTGVATLGIISARRGFFKSAKEEEAADAEAAEVAVAASAGEVVAELTAVLLRSSPLEARLSAAGPGSADTN